VPLDLSLTTAFAGSRRRIAYERLLLDLIEGDQTLFVRRDEVEAQWSWVDAIRASFGPTPAEAQKLRRGSSWGLAGEADCSWLGERDGVSWHEAKSLSREGREEIVDASSPTASSNGRSRGAPPILT
jgi:glucose-6-phosphate 1-dehydrogenase